MLGLRLDQPLPLDGPRGGRSTSDELERLARLGLVVRERGHARAHATAAASSAAASPPACSPDVGRRLRRAAYHEEMQMPLCRAPGRHPPPRRRGVRRDGPARRLEDARRARGARRLALDGAERARRARAARPADASAHLGRPRADRGRLPALRRPPALDARSRGPAGVLARPAGRARRGRGGAADDDRDALAGDAAARGRLGAAASRRRPSATSRCCCCSRTSSWSS